MHCRDAVSKIGWSFSVTKRRRETERSSKYQKNIFFRYIL